MVIGEEALCPLAGHLVHRMNEEHLVPSLSGFVHAADNDAGFHGGVVKEVGTETQHALHHVVGNQFFAHHRFFVAEEDAMGKQYGAAAALGLHAFNNMLPEGIIGTTLGRGAVDVSAPRIGGPGFSVPLFDGVRRISKDQIELHEPVAFYKGGTRQGIAPDDTEVFNAVQKQIHPSDSRGEQVAWRLAVSAVLSGFWVHQRRPVSTN